MRRLIGQMLAISVVTACLIAISAAAGVSETTCQPTNPVTGECLIWVQIPGGPDNSGDLGSDDSKDSYTGQACYWDPKRQGVDGPPAGLVYCNTDSVLARALSRQLECGAASGAYESSDFAAVAMLSTQGLDLEADTARPANLTLNGLESEATDPASVTPRGVSGPRASSNWGG